MNHSFVRSAPRVLAFVVAIFGVPAAVTAADAAKPMFSPSVWIADTLHVAGQGPRNPKTDKEPDGFEAKVRQAIDNCGQILKDEGLGFANVVNVNLLLTDLSQLPIVDRIYQQYFPKNPPARTVLGVPALPKGIPFEITVTASRLRNRKIISPPGSSIPASRLRSPGVLVGDILYISGQLGHATPAAPAPNEDLETEVKRTLDNIRAVLKAAGMDRENLVSGVVFLADFATYDRMNEVYKAYFAGVTPSTRTCVGLGPLPNGSRVAMSFIAAKAAPGKAAKIVITPPGEGPSGLFVPGLFVGETVYLSGRAGYADGGIGPQVDEIMNRMTQVLSAASMDLSQVAETKVYLADMNDFAAMNAAYIKHFPGRPPARTTIAISKLHRESRVEMTLVAQKPKSATGAAAPSTPYDLLFKGGRIIDPANGIDKVADLAIAGGRIAALGPSIPLASSHKVIDAKGLLVTPGLVDMHAHFLAPPNSALGALLWVDSHTLRSCVTTVVDAGGSGWRDFPQFKKTVMDKTITRSLAFVNIVGRGMGTTEEQQDVSDMDAAKTAELAKRYPGVVVGIKTAHFKGPAWTSVERAVEAGRLANLPTMVDFGTFHPARPFKTLISEKMRPGDIYTHTYLVAVPLLDDNLHVFPYFAEARRRGILFDVGHGQGSFLFRQAIPAIKQGFLADTISTDLHAGSMNSGMKDMTNVMSKFLSIGVPLQKVIALSTSAPAKSIRRPDLGHLGVGAAADVALLRTESGHYSFVDTHKTRMDGKQRIFCEMTIRDGFMQFEREGKSHPRWDTLGKYDTQSDPRWDATGQDKVAPVVEQKP